MPSRLSRALGPTSVITENGLAEGGVYEYPMPDGLTRVMTLTRGAGTHTFPTPPHRYPRKDIYPPTLLGVCGQMGKVSSETRGTPLYHRPSGGPGKAHPS